MTGSSTLHPSTGFAGINLACGGKLCREPGWINADHNPSAKDVVKVDLLGQLPFPDQSFDVVYHSQFIEHLPADKALAFMRECFRILKPKGVLRVVTPDLQDQATEYLRTLQAVLASPDDEQARLRYEWIRLEMLDQLTRHASGGEMVPFLQDSGLKVRDYLVQRMGRSGENLIPVPEDAATVSTAKKLLRPVRDGLRAGKDKLLPTAHAVGSFRLSGESHLCMYDAYLLSQLLRRAGFDCIAKVGARDSRLPGWDKTLLDCDPQGRPDCGVSLFMEAARPANT